MKVDYKWDAIHTYNARFEGATRYGSLLWARERSTGASNDSASRIFLLEHLLTRVRRSNGMTLKLGFPFLPVKGAC